MLPRKALKRRVSKFNWGLGEYVAPSFKLRGFVKNSLVNKDIPSKVKTNFAVQCSNSGYTTVG